MASMLEKTRVQFDFTPDALGQLDDLKGRIKASNRAEVVRNALRVLQWLVDTLKSGGRILVERDGKVESVVFPFLGEQKTSEEANRPLRVAVS